MHELRLQNPNRYKQRTARRVWGLDPKGRDHFATTLTLRLEPLPAKGDVTHSMNHAPFSPSSEAETEQTMIAESGSTTVREQKMGDGLRGFEGLAALLMVRHLDHAVKAITKSEISTPNINYPITSPAP